MQPELFSRWTLPISQPSWRRRQRRRKRASSSFTKLLTTLTARSPTRSGSARERTILEQTAGGLETMELLVTNQKTAKYTNILLLLATQILLAALGHAQTTSLPEPPQVRAKNHVVSLTLRAVNENGRDAFAFNGTSVAPVIRASPGDVLKITYINDLPAKSTETCAVNPCMDMTNLPFHGLTVSPDAPQDDVLSMLATPGHILHYSVEIPRNHPPGLFWYHTHPHGESHRQVLDGMSGAIRIEGMERYAPQMARLRERVIVVRGRSIEHDPKAAELRRSEERRVGKECRSRWSPYH